MTIDYGSIFAAAYFAMLVVMIWGIIEILMGGGPDLPSGGIQA